MKKKKQKHPGNGISVAVNERGQMRMGRLIKANRKDREYSTAQYNTAVQDGESYPELPRCN